MERKFEFAKGLGKGVLDVLVNTLCIGMASGVTNALTRNHEHSPREKAGYYAGAGLTMAGEVIAATCLYYKLNSGR